MAKLIQWKSLRNQLVIWIVVFLRKSLRLVVLRYSRGATQALAVNPANLPPN